MRRKDKEITSQEIIKWILQEAVVCRISMVDEGKPYIVPMNFAYHENCLYLHSAPEGKKIDILQKNNLVCFEVDINTEVVNNEQPCKWSMRYLSVIGSGKVLFINNYHEKKKALDIIMEKYSGLTSHNYSSQIIDSILIIKVEIEEMIGKKSGY